MLTWCKLYIDILGDAKLLRAARRGARDLVVLPWLFAWARAHDSTDRGRLVLDGEPAEPEDIAAQLPGVTPAQVAACMAGAEQIGVLVRDDDQALRFATWEERSGRASSRPSDSRDAVRERVRLHRERRRNAAAEPGNAAPVSAGNDGNALRNAVDREGELEQERDGAERARDAAPGPAGVTGVEARDAAPLAAPLDGPHEPPLELPAPLELPPPLVQRLWRERYRRATPERWADVVRQLDEVVSPTGTVARRRPREVVRATPAVLARAVTLALAEPIRDPDRTIVVVLRKCTSGDAVTPPDANGDLPAEAEARRAADNAADADQEFAERQEAASAWLDAHPEARDPLWRQVEADVPGGGVSAGFLAHARAARLVQLVEQRAGAVGEPAGIP